MNSMKSQDDTFYDPITLELIVDPVVASDGITYDRWSAFDLMEGGVKVRPHNLCAQGF